MTLPHMAGYVVSQATDFHACQMWRSRSLMSIEDLMSASSPVPPLGAFPAAATGVVSARPDPELLGVVHARYPVP